MVLSARNHLAGSVEEITRERFSATRRADHQIESVITRRSADGLGLKNGDRVMAVVKATDVMIAKP